MLIDAVMVLNLGAAAAYIVLSWRFGIMFHPGEIPPWFPRGAPPILAAARRHLRVVLVLAALTLVAVAVQATDLQPVLSQPLWRQILALAALAHLYAVPKLWITAGRLQREARRIRIPLRLYS